jgi:hypothetical protein
MFPHLKIVRGSMILHMSHRPKQRYMVKEMPGVRTVLLVAIAAGMSAWVVHLWLFSDAAWLHPELLGSSYYVWLRPETDTLWSQLRRVFDWKAFDPNVNRVRPLNDLFEVIDAIARPYLTQRFGPRPALLPSAVLTVALLPPLWFAWLRGVLKEWKPALLLTLLVVASPAFLSTTIASMHPAKRISMLFLAAALYLAQRHAESGRGFATLLAVLLGGFLADEAGLAAYPVVAALYGRSIVQDRRRLAAYLLLPVAFLVIARWLLPTVYLRFGVHGAWDALADRKKLAVFAYLLEPGFHVAAARQMARSILSTLGVAWHVPATEIGVLVAIAAATIWLARARNMRAAAAFVALVASSAYLTLLDWYPFPREISYLGSFNYYYHSPVALLVVGWLAMAATSIPRTFRTAAAVLAVAAAVGNLVLFERVNSLAATIHLYPYSNAALISALSSRDSAVLEPDPAGESARFERTLRQTFGSRWRENGFYRTHLLLKPTPLMGETQIKLLWRAHYPHEYADVLGPR